MRRSELSGYKNKEADKTGYARIIYYYLTINTYALTEYLIAYSKLVYCMTDGPANHIH